MREIIFRAKGKYKNRWYYGNFIEYKRTCEYFVVDFDELITRTDHQIDPDTVGQFTGLTDKNGKKIFEGDIIEVTCKFKGKLQYENCGIVKYNQSNCSFQLEIFTDDSIDFPLFESVDYGDNDKQDTFIIIGNIYDNPEMIKENEDD